MKKKRNSNIPRHKRMCRESRLQAAKHWIPRYEGENILKGYSKHFAVDKICAIKELEILGYKFDREYVKQLLATIEGQQNAKRRRILEREQAKNLITNTDSDDRFYFIAGYTSAGFPYGITWEEMDVDYFASEVDLEDDIIDEDDNYDIPF